MLPPLLCVSLGFSPSHSLALGVATGLPLSPVNRGGGGDETKTRSKGAAKHVCCIIVLVHTHTLTLPLHSRLSDWRARPNRRYSEYSQSGVKGEGEALRADGTSEGLISPSALRSTSEGVISQRFSQYPPGATPYRGAVARTLSDQQPPDRRGC